MRRHVHVLVTTALLWPAVALAQTATVDYDRDVKPILREKCVGCHGTAQPQAGLRLDRRDKAMLGTVSNGVVIVPGNSARSRLVWRISGSEYGPQMPPTGALAPAQIETIKRWIDQGAVWPEAAAAPRAADLRVQRYSDALRSGDRAAISRAAIDRAAVNATDADGETPLFAATLYGTLADMRALIEKGADVNARNDNGVVPLVLAASDTAKLQLLLEHGANPNQRSEDGRTALHVAAQRGDLDAVRLLLARGATTIYQNGDSPLALAAGAGNPEVVAALMQAGAPVTRQAGVEAAVNAAISGCAPCIELLAREAEPVALGMGLAAAADIGSLATMKLFIDKGAPLEVTDLFGGATPLMFAVVSERDARAKVELLLQKGANINAHSELGETALDYAKRRNDPAIIDALSRAAAANTARDLKTSIERSIALLQKADVRFVKNTGCISCHNDVLPHMLVVMAEKKGLTVDRIVADAQFKAVVSYLDDRRARAWQGLDIPGAQDTLSYLLADLDAHDYPPSPTTDAWARYLRMVQLPDGHWQVTAHRPPIESNDIEVTALSLKAIKRYAPAADRAAYDERVRAAAAWLGAAKASTTEERAFRLLGLKWAGAPQAAIAEAAKELRAAQRPDGGWAQIATLESDAYATGEALVALHEGAAMLPADPVYQRGVGFLLKTQHDDGAWLVKTRTVALQPQFDSGFPGGRDQWISAAATAWAGMALVLGMP